MLATGIKGCCGWNMRSLQLRGPGLDASHTWVFRILKGMTGFPGDASDKELSANAEDLRDVGSIPR